MQKNTLPKLMFKYLIVILIIIVPIVVITTEASSLSTGSSSEKLNNSIVLPESFYHDYMEEASLIITLTHQDAFSLTQVYTEDPVTEVPVVETPVDDVDEEDPDPEVDEEEPETEDPEPEPEPDEEPEPETDEIKYTTIEVTTLRGESVSGSIELEEGASVTISEQPGNGAARVDQDGNWEYTPERDFIGEDQFEITVDLIDGAKEIITVKVLVEEPDAEVIEEVDENDTHTTLPSSGGSILASVLALWLFVLASITLRKGIIKQKL